MTKLNWSRARRYQNAAKPKGATSAQWVRSHSKPYSSRATPFHEEICIVIGANAPRNKTGERQVKIFRSLAEAHKAGFTWAV